MKELLFKTGDVLNIPNIEERDDNTIYYAKNNSGGGDKDPIISFGKDEVALKTELGELRREISELHEKTYTKEEVASLLKNYTTKDEVDSLLNVSLGPILKLLGIRL